MYRFLKFQREIWFFPYFSKRVFYSLFCIWRMLCGNTHSFLSVFKTSRASSKLHFSSLHSLLSRFPEQTLPIYLNCTSLADGEFWWHFHVKKNWNLKELFSFREKKILWKLNTSLKKGFVFNPSNPQTNLSWGIEPKSMMFSRNIYIGRFRN